MTRRPSRRLVLATTATDTGPLTRLLDAGLLVHDCSRDLVVWDAPPTEAERAFADELLGSPRRHVTR